MAPAVIAIAEDMRPPWRLRSFIAASIVAALMLPLFILP